MSREKYAVIRFDPDGEEIVYMSEYKDIAMDYYNEWKDEPGPCFLCEVKLSNVN